MKLVDKTDPILHQVMPETTKGKYLDRIIHEMFELIDDVGIGLAANQVGITERLIVMDVKGIRQAVINPVITKRFGGKKKSHEGCLSYPNQRVKKTRYKQVLLEGYNEDWEPVRLKLRGLPAICAQHEVDHLNGITIGE